MFKNNDKVQINKIRNKNYNMSTQDFFFTVSKLQNILRIEMIIM